MEFSKFHKSTLLTSTGGKDLGVLSLNLSPKLGLRRRRTNVQGYANVSQMLLKF